MVDLDFGRVLFAGAHLDDVEFGCGGLIAQLAPDGDVHLLTLSKHTRSSKGEIQIVRDLEEPLRAASMMGLPAERVAMETLDGQLFQSQAQEVREIFLQWRRNFDPDTVFVPARDDLHQDHQVVCAEALRIFRDRTVIGFEVVRSTLEFRPNLFVGISEVALEKKISAVLCYQSQLTQSAGYYFKPEILRGQAAFRGGQSNKALAEAFEIYFMNVRGG